VVTNSETGEPVPTALIEIINTDWNLRFVKRADKSGRYYKGNLPPGIYKFVISAPGFERREIVQRLYVTRVGTVPLLNAVR